MFTTPDGTSFDDRDAYRKHLFKTVLGIQDQEDAAIIRADCGVERPPFQLTNLTNCTVIILDVSSQVQADNLKHCRVFVAACSSSVFLRGCTDCHFTVAAGQLRLRDCVNCSFGVYCKNDPVIENSTHLTFAPFNGACVGLDTKFADAGFNPKDNHWAEVFDFGGDASREVAATWRKLDPTQWAAADGSFSHAGLLALLYVFNHFDKDGDGEWSLEELNLYQTATGEATFATEQDAAATFAQLDLPVTERGHVPWFSFVKLGTLEGVDDMRADLARAGFDTSQCTTEWVVRLGADDGHEPVNPVPADAGVIVASAGGLRHDGPVPVTVSHAAGGAGAGAGAGAGVGVSDAGASGADEMLAQQYQLVLHPVLTNVLRVAAAANRPVDPLFRTFDTTGCGTVSRARFDAAIIGLVYGPGVDAAVGDQAAAVSPEVLSALADQLAPGGGAAADAVAYQPLLELYQRLGGPAPAPAVPTPATAAVPAFAASSATLQRGGAAGGADGRGGGGASRRPTPGSTRPLPDATTLVNRFEDAMDALFKTKPTAYTQLRRAVLAKPVGTGGSGARDGPLTTVAVARHLRAHGLNAKHSIITLLLLRAGGTPCQREVAVRTPAPPPSALSTPPPPPPAVASAPPPSSSAAAAPSTAAVAGAPPPSSSNGAVLRSPPRVRPPPVPTKFSLLSQGKSVVKAPVDATPRRYTTVPSATITPQAFCDYLAKLRRGHRTMDSDSARSTAASTAASPPKPKTPAASARRVVLYRKALAGDIPPKHATSWLSRRDVELCVATHRPLPSWAVAEEVRKQAAEWMDSRQGRAAMWARVAHAQRTAAPAGTPASDVSVTAAMRRQARKAALEAHTQLLNTQLATAGDIDIQLFWLYVSAVRVHGESGSFSDWLRERYETWWRNRRRLQAYMADKREEAVRQRREDSQVAVAGELVDKVQALVARAAKPGMDITTRMTRLRRWADAQPTATSSCAAASAGAGAGAGAVPTGIISRRDFFTELRGVLLALTTLPATAADARKLLDARGAAELELAKLLRTPAGRAQLEEEMEVAAYADDDHDDGGGDGSDGGSADQEAAVEAKAKAAMLDRLYKDIVVETFADSGDKTVELAEERQAQRQAEASERFGEWKRKKRAEQLRAAKAAAAAAAVEAKEKKQKKAAARRAFRKWLRDDKRGCYTSTRAGAPRRVPRPKSGVVRGRPAWVSPAPADGDDAAATASTVDGISTVDLASTAFTGP